MRKVHLYITSSIDGYIARENGSVDWLFEEGEYGYENFVSKIDTVIMGGETYRWVLDSGFDWPYRDQKSFVITRNKTLSSTEDIQFWHDDIGEKVNELKSKSGKDIWLVGGGQVNTIFLNEDLIDKIWWYIHPVVLGKGLPLFAHGAIESWFTVENCRHFEDGMIEVIYAKK